MDTFGHNRPRVPNHFPGQLPLATMRPFGPQGHDPRPRVPNHFPGQLPLAPMQPFGPQGHDPRPRVPNHFPGQLPLAPMRPFGPQGHDPLISAPEFNEMGTLHKFQDGNSISQIGPNWKRPSPPAPGMHHSSVPGIRPPTRSTSGAWDLLDVNQLQRDSKRSRTNGAFPIGNLSRNIDNHGFGLEQTYRIDPVIDGGGSGPKSHLGPVGNRISAAFPGSVTSVQLDVDHIWRGTIAKGGTYVCCARCVPIGKGIATELPDVINCAAKIGLDVLTKHYADAAGFDVVFFLPDSEADFASYTEFINYLKAKNRAGVVKFVDDTTLFLVPPSDFLTKVLRVIGPERLYGVVLKFPLNPSTTPMQQSMHLPSPSTHYMPHILPMQAEYGSISAKQEQVLPVDYNRLLHEDSKLSPKPVHPARSGLYSVHSVPSYYLSNNTVSELLTPELIATLNSLLPATQSSATVAAKTSVDSSTVKPPFPPFAPHDGNQAHLWKQDHQITYPTSHHPQQFGSSYNVQSAQYHFYPPASTPYHYAQVVSGSDSSHFQDTAASLQQLGTVSSKPMPNFTIPSQSGQVAVSPQVGQQYHVDVSTSTQGTDVSLLYSSNRFQQPSNFIASSAQVPSANGLQQQTVTPYTADTADSVNSEPPKQQHQPAFFGVGQGMSELESDRNQRDQSTLQFASNLLLQIQQQQPQGGHGPGNQQ